MRDLPGSIRNLSVHDETVNRDKAANLRGENPRSAGSYAGPSATSSTPYRQGNRPLKAQTDADSDIRG